MEINAAEFKAKCLKLLDEVAAMHEPLIVTKRGRPVEKDVAIYFVNRKQGAADLQALHLDIFGDIENWPENFFGDEMGEIAARTTAALRRQAQAQDGA